MNEAPLVSVVIIFLNEERFLREAIESVIAQSYHHWELLLVDDGSTDASPGIAQSFAAEHPEKIRYLTHPDRENRGMSASRNLGIQQASGTYISYLDGDDVWLENKLERQVSLLSDTPEAAMVYGPLLLWFSWTGRPEDQNEDFIYGLQAYNLTVEGDRLFHPPLLLAKFLRHYQLIPAGIMIKREAILEVGGYEEQFRGSFEDAVLLTKICLKFPVYVSKECWYHYRQHPDSCTGVAEREGRLVDTRLRFLNWVEDYLKRQNVENQTVWNALRKQRWALLNPKLNTALGKVRIALGAVKRSLLHPG